MISLADLDVVTPSSLGEALEILAERAGKVRVLAGGTDLIVQMRHRMTPKTDLLNIYALDELRYVKLEDGYVKIGALTDFSTIYSSPLVRRAAPVLAEAAFAVGSVQIMNKATLGGNIVNASPAADSLPPLYVLDANLILKSRSSVRTVPIDEFYKGYKKLDIRPDELLVEVSFKPLPDNYSGRFFKHGLRQGDAISVVNGAVLIGWDNETDTIADARVALGAVAPTVVRATECEKMLVGAKLDDETMWRAAEAVKESISPIDDVRGSAAYRREMCINYVYMTLWILSRKVKA
ncbi:MAG: xanthine dehydrogenase family protein subunit M [Candidatus Caldarchaeum sp.]